MLMTSQQNLSIKAIISLVFGMPVKPTRLRIIMSNSTENPKQKDQLGVSIDEESTSLLGLKNSRIEGSKLLEAVHLGGQGLERNVEHQR